MWKLACYQTLLCLRNLATSRINNDCQLFFSLLKNRLGNWSSKASSDFGNEKGKLEISNIELKEVWEKAQFSTFKIGNSKISISCHASSFFAPFTFELKNSLHEWVFTSEMTSSPHFGPNRLIFYRSWIATRQLIWGLVDYLLLYSAHARGDKQI